jgi:hypothetical protein
MPAAARLAQSACVGFVGRPLFPNLPCFFERICEQAQENCFNCFPYFWHIFWRFIEEWAGGTTENNPY